MHSLSRGGRATAPFGASRPGCLHGISHGKIALMLQHQAPRQALLACAAAKRKSYQDMDGQNELLRSMGSMDELGEGLDKFTDLLGNKKAAGAARTPPGAQNGRAPKTVAQQQQQAPPPPARAPASFGFDDPNTLDDFGDLGMGFEGNWLSPLPNYGGNGGGGGGGGGGYYNGSGGGGGGGGGYMNGSGYGGGYGGNYGNYSQGGGGGYMNGGGYGGGSDWSYGSYTSTSNRGRKTSLRYDDFSDDVDEIDGEKPVVKVDSCVINGKTLQCNHGITLREVFVLGAGPERPPLGMMPTSRARALADEAKEDLLLINPDASPPVARIVKWSKYKFELEKGAKERKAKSAATETKEVRLRPSTDSGDLQVKLKSCMKFLTKGDRVKLVMRFEGRELQFKEQGKEVLLNFISSLSSVAKVEGPLNFKTGTYTIMLAPNK